LWVFHQSKQGDNESKCSVRSLVVKMAIISKVCDENKQKKSEFTVGEEGWHDYSSVS